MSPHSNPFSTRFTCPGAIPFLFGEHLRSDSIWQKFESSHWVAQIVGSHGSGKTSLVRTLESALKTRFANIKYLTIRKPSIRLIIESQFAGFDQDNSGRPDLLVVDGVESLTQLNRWLLKTWCQKNSTGLLATVHQPIRWLPTIATLRPEPSTFLTICDWLQRPAEIKLEHAICEQALDKANGNFREAFMALYDQYETRALRKMHLKA